MAATGCSHLGRGRREGRGGEHNCWLLLHLSFQPASKENSSTRSWRAWGRSRLRAGVTLKYGCKASTSSQLSCWSSEITSKLDLLVFLPVGCMWGSNVALRRTWGRTDLLSLDSLLLTSPCGLLWLSHECNQNKWFHCVIYISLCKLFLQTWNGQFS